MERFGRSWISQVYEEGLGWMNDELDGWVGR